MYYVARERKRESSECTHAYASWLRNLPLEEDDPLKEAAGFVWSPRQDVQILVGFRA